MLPGQHSVPLMALKGLLDEVGIKLPMYKVRDIIERLKENNETDNGETLSNFFILKHVNYQIPK